MNKYYHVIPLSNFILGFSKYETTYDKNLVPNNKFPNQFYLLEMIDIQIGIDKTLDLIEKLNIKNNVPLVIETKQDNVKPNIRNNKGVYIETTKIQVNNVFLVINGSLHPILFEDATAKAYDLNFNQYNFQTLTPRSISILPIAKGCQAKCKFCFSESSISVDQKNTSLDFNIIGHVLQQSSEKGAIRAVITGGGEPGLLPKNQLVSLIELCHSYFKKTVLISNGCFLKDDMDFINELDDAGLSVLSLSVHHHYHDINTEIMGVDTKLETLLNAVKGKIFKNLKLRLVCVLQKKGISNEQDILDYLHWGVACGVDEFTFKELYISSSTDSIYYSKDSNKYCIDNQVLLSLLNATAEKYNWAKIDELPWGAPIFKAIINGRAIKIAAYTEPSVGWELKNNICRSWNLMSDYLCYSSLETKKSLINV